MRTTVQKILFFSLCNLSLIHAQQQYPIDDLCDLPGSGCRTTPVEQPTYYRYWIATGMITAVAVWFFTDGDIKKAFERLTAWRQSRLHSEKQL